MHPAHLKEAKGAEAHRERVENCDCHCGIVERIISEGDGDLSTEAEPVQDEQGCVYAKHNINSLQAVVRTLFA